MKNIRILVFLVLIILEVGCGKNILLIDVKSPVDITKYFKKIDKKLGKYQKDKETEKFHITLAFLTNKSYGINDIKVTFYFKNSEKMEYLLKTNYPNEFEYNSESIKDLLKVTCVNISKNDHFKINRIFAIVYNPIKGRSFLFTTGFQLNLPKKKIKVNFANLNDFALFDKKQNIFIDKDRKEPPQKDYLDICKKLKNILYEDYKWLNNDWNVKFVLTSSYNYIREHYFPLNYFVIYIPKSGYGDNFWFAPRQRENMESLLHEITEMNIVISCNFDFVSTRFIHEGLTELISEKIIEKLDKKAHFSLIDSKF